MTADHAAPSGATPTRAVPVALADETYVDFAARIRHHAAEGGERTAVIEGAARLSWRGLGDVMDLTAGRLTRKGLGPGDAVAIAGEPSVDYIVAFLATVAAGGCAVPLPLMASDASLASMIHDSGAKILLLADSCLDRFEAIVGADARLAELDRMALDTGLGRLARLDDVGATAIAPWVVPADARFNIIYSSGTTGVPKGIVHDQSFRTRQADRMRNLGLGPGKLMATTTAMYSNTTLVAALGALANGAAVSFMRKFDSAAFFDIVEHERATHAMLVPVLCPRLLGHPSFPTRDLGSLECTLVTSSPFSPRIKTEMAELWPGVVWEMYGLTEGGLTTMLDVKAFPDKRTTVGRTSTHAFVRVVDEAGREVPAGVVGEVIGRSPTMMVGYHGRPDLTAASLLRFADGEIYFRTGDLGSFDADGFLTISGRAKDVIISGGFNIYAIDLEEALCAHPAVADAAVIGVAHDIWGETPVGIVVPRDGETIDRAALIEETNRRLGRNQRLSAVHVVEELPRNALGKVTKDVLRKTFGTAATDPA